jgi:hypothetical protein
MNLTRIRRFLEAMDQYGKVIEVFLNDSSMLCVVWGPMKFCLQVRSFQTRWSETHMLRRLQVPGLMLSILFLMHTNSLPRISHC